MSHKFPPDEVYTTRVIKAFVEAVEEEVRRPVHLSSESDAESHHRSVLHVLPEPQVPLESDIPSTKSMIAEIESEETLQREVLKLEERKGGGEPGLGALSGEGGEGEEEEEEEDEEGVSAELCDALCTSLTTRSSTHPSEWCHRTYAYSPPHDNHATGDLVTVRMAHNMLQGSTG